MLTIPYSSGDKYLVSIGSNKNGIAALIMDESVYIPDALNREEFKILKINCIILKIFLLVLFQQA
jgi:hypothetical protein